MFNFLKSLFGQSDATRPTKPSSVDSQATVARTPSTTRRSPGYRATVLEKHGFQLPASEYEKSTLGQKYEREGDLKKAIACYEGCMNNQADGSFVYNRLAVIYRKLHRRDDEVRILKKAIFVYSKEAGSGQSSADGKLQKFEARLSKLTGE